MPASTRVASAKLNGEDGKQRLAKVQQRGSSHTIPRGQDVIMH